MLKEKSYGDRRCAAGAAPGRGLPGDPPAGEGRVAVVQALREAGPPPSRLSHLPPGVSFGRETWLGPTRSQEVILRQFRVGCWGCGAGWWR